MIFSSFERMVAMRYLRARRSEGFVSVNAIFSFLGIMLGVATLIIVMSVMNGFRGELLGRILGLNAHITISAPIGASFTDFDALTQKILNVPGVAQAAPMIDGQVMATANSIAGGALVHGLKSADLQARTLLSSHIIAGSIPSLDDDSVMIGSAMAQRLGLEVGGEITLISPTGNVTVIGTLPRVKAYRVAAVFDVGMYEYDNTYIYMTLAAAQRFFQMPEGAGAIEVNLARADDAPKIAQDLFAVMPKGVRILDWQRAWAGYFNAVIVERNVMFFILTLIIIVAAFNIISSMIMLVKDKGRDIAVMRTMGATRGMIQRVFFLTGASIGGLGTLGGLALGVTFTTNIEAIRHWLESFTGTNLFNAEIYFLSHLPAVVDWREVGEIVIMALVLTVLATLYPSRRAARLDPVEALRYE